MCIHEGRRWHEQDDGQRRDLAVIGVYTCSSFLDSDLGLAVIFCDGWFCAPRRCCEHSQLSIPICPWWFSVLADWSDASSSLFVNWGGESITTRG